MLISLAGPASKPPPRTKPSISITGPIWKTAAKGLELTSRVLSKALDVPAKNKDALPNQAGELGKDALKLREAAKAQDVRQATENCSASI